MDHGHRIYKNSYPKADSQIYLQSKCKTKYFKMKCLEVKTTGKLKVDIKHFLRRSACRTFRRLHSLETSLPGDRSVLSPIVWMCSGVNSRQILQHGVSKPQSPHPPVWGWFSSSEPASGMWRFCVVSGKTRRKPRHHHEYEWPVRQKWVIREFLD